jgi:hypothetical protein
MRIATLVVAALLATVVVASAQSPYIAVYFDQYFTEQQTFCQGIDVQDTWYVVAVNFNTFVSGFEFMIQYPGAVSFLNDLDTPPITIGDTESGITMGYPFPPLNGFEPILICRSRVIWNCDDCQGLANLPVAVVPHPYTGDLVGVDYHTNELIPAIGMTSLICPVGVPTQDTTWGQVKALYE